MDACAAGHAGVFRMCVCVCVNNETSELDRQKVIGRGWGWTRVLLGMQVSRCLFVYCVLELMCCLIHCVRLQTPMC